MVYLLTMVIFYSYVKLPEGSRKWRRMAWLWIVIVDHSPIPYWAPASVSIFFHWGQTSSTAHDPVFRGWVPQFKIVWYSCAGTLWIWGEDDARIGLSQNCGSHYHHWSPIKNEPFHQFWIITWGPPMKFKCLSLNMIEPRMIHHRLTTFWTIHGYLEPGDPSVRPLHPSSRP